MLARLWTGAEWSEADQARAILKKARLFLHFCVSDHGVNHRQLTSIMCLGKDVLRIKWPLLIPEGVEALF